MAKKQLWQDDYWLLLMQQYLRRPVGIKPVFSRSMVDLSLELHITPQELHERMGEIARLRTPRIERLWQEYSQNPRRLSRAVSLLRSMKGFNSGGHFFEGVDVQETFERDFRPLAEDGRLTPVMLTLVLDLYFRLTPATMVSQTPEVLELARLLHIPTALVVDVLDVFQHCDPYLHRRDVSLSRLLLPCTQVWQRYGNGDVRQLADYAEQLKAYYL
ncbi:MAG: hypothetical protein II886_02770 [Prevotella sp.]|nr:hypothetical protein [Prevotella sp.]